MKKLLFSLHFSVYIFACHILLVNSAFPQNPLVKQWDYRFGGTGKEEISSFQQTTDGGYIIGGWSLSGISGDKTQPLLDTCPACFYAGDMWIVKTDAAGNKQWDKTFGGVDYDYLSSVQQTSDGGYILGGSSLSGISGDKTQLSRGDLDYWIIKTDAFGSKQWDKRFGGTSTDFFSSLHQTSDGGYILGGYSFSGIGGDKAQNIWGVGYPDYWIVKIDSLGIKQWDKDFGGMDWDELHALKQTADGGYIFGGRSLSGIGGDKTQNVWGTAFDCDYWIVKTDSMGNKQWDKDFGTVNGDWLYDIQQTIDGGYILGGYTSSGISGDKTQNSWGFEDYWIIKIDALGNKQWDRDYGGTDGDYFRTLVVTADSGYLFTGTSSSNMGGDKTEDNLAPSQIWIIKTDLLGNKQWDKTLLINGKVHRGAGIQSEDLCYVIVNDNNGIIGGHKTQSNWNGSMDYWIIKFCDSTLTTSVTQLPDTHFPFSIYPNPANEYVIIVYHFKAGDEILLTDVLGKLLSTTKITAPALNFKLSTLNLSTGIYFLKAGNEVRKFIKE